MNEHAFRPHLVVEQGTRLGQSSVLIFGAAILRLTLSLALGPRGPGLFDEP